MVDIENYFPETNSEIVLENNLDKLPNERIGYQFDEKEIFEKALLLLESKILQEESKDDVLSKIPKTIDWDNLYSDTLNLLKKLIIIGDGASVISLLPKAINLGESSAELINVLGLLVKNNFASDVINRLQKIPNFNRLPSYQTNLLDKLIETGFVKEVAHLLPKLKKNDNLSPWYISLISKISLLESDFKEQMVRDLREFIPEEIDMSKIDYSETGFLELLIELDSNFEQLFLKRIKSGIDVLLINPDQLNILEIMLKKNFGNHVADLIKPSNKNIEIGIYSSYLLRTMAELGFGQKVLEIVKDNSGKTSPKAFHVYEALVLNGFADEVIELDILSEAIINSSDFVTIYNFLNALIDCGYGKKVIDGIKPFDLSDIDHDSEEMLTKLVKKGFSKEVLNLLPKNIDHQFFRNIAGDLYISLVSNDELFRQNFFENLPESFSLAQAKDLKLSGLISAGFSTEIISRFSGANDLFSEFSYEYYKDEEQKDFLTTLARKGHTNELQQLFSKQIAEVESSMRQPIDPDQLDIWQKAGPNLYEIIKNFRVNSEESIKKLKNGWFRAKFEKGEGDFGYIYIWLKSKEFKVVFRSQNINEESLDNYQKALTLIPNFVSRKTYPELQPSETGKENLQTKTLFSDSFREVYAGITLEDLHLSALPKKIRDSILNQRKFILLKLAINGIDHGHPHDANFNVRFLLEKDGKKQILFDVNLAIKKAVENKMSITPIVTLRDWDKAKS